MRKKSAEDTVKVHVGYLLVSIFLIMWCTIPVVVNLCVWVMTLFLLELPFSWSKKKTCNARLFGDRDGVKNDCQGSLEQQWNRFCPPHQAYHQRSCGQYHLADAWERENHGYSDTVELFLRRLNKSLV